MGSDARAWDRLTAGIRRVLPEWARYQGYGTYALAGYLWATIMAIVAIVVYTAGHQTAGFVAAAIGAVAWLLGSYYKGAAKVRVECNHCGQRARGESFCPECGEQTYIGSDSV